MFKVILSRLKVWRPKLQKDPLSVKPQGLSILDYRSHNYRILFKKNTGQVHSVMHVVKGPHSQYRFNPIANCLF